MHVNDEDSTVFSHADNISDKAIKKNIFFNLKTLLDYLSYFNSSVAADFNNMKIFPVQSPKM